MKKLLILLVFMLTQAFASAQSTFIPYNRDYYHLIDRFQIKFGNPDNFLQTTFKPLRRVDLANFLLGMQDQYETPTLSYTNYRNPLAHPLGANFKELILSARYQPINKLHVTGKIIRSTFGEDENGLNYGGNLLSTTDDRIGNLGNRIGQGVATTNTYVELLDHTCSYKTYLLTLGRFIETLIARWPHALQVPLSLCFLSDGISLNVSMNSERNINNLPQKLTL